MYIGEVKIIKHKELDPLYYTVTTENGVLKMSKVLFDTVAKKEKGNGTITDVVKDYFAYKFLGEMAAHGLDYYFAEQVSTGITILAHNLREEAIGRAFSCKSAYDIPLQTFFNQPSEYGKAEKSKEKQAIA